MNHVVTDFVTLLVVVNPLGKLPIFLAMTAGLPAERRRAIALQAVLIAFGILLFFIVCGQILLGALGVDIDAFRLAGSLVLLLFGLQMVFGTGPRPAAGESGQDLSDTDRAVFPLAVPAIAGPGTMMAVVVLTDNERFTLLEQANTTATLVVVLLISWAAMRLADPLLRLIRPAGANVIGRVMGVILASLAVDGMVEAVIAIVRSVPRG